MLALPAGTVALWTVVLDPADLPALAPLLSEAEHARAARLTRAPARAQMVLARGWTRRLLGAWCGIDPRLLVIEADANGKPWLRGAAAGVAFSLSHAGGRLLLAAASVPVGVDLEQARPLPELPGMAGLALDAAEQAALARLPPARREAGFLRLWVRKEAVVKGLGGGLACPLPRVAVGAPQRRARLTALPPGAGPAACWTLRDLAAPRGWAAALAVRAPVCRPVWQIGWSDAHLSPSVDVW